MNKFYPITLYLRYLPNLIMLSLSLFLNLAVWIWLLWQIKPIAEPIFLHYNILFGVDLVGPWWKVLYLPIIGCVILLVNAILGWLLFGRDKFIAQFLNAVTVLCQMFLFIAAALLVFLNV